MNPGQPLLLAFFPPVVCELVMLSSALRRMASERAWSVTTRETVSAPIRVNAATSARTWRPRASSSSTVAPPFEPGRGGDQNCSLAHV